MKATVEQINRLEIRETIQSNKKYIQFDFSGYLDHPTAVKGIETWKQYMIGAERHDLIYNCAHMSGFDSTARQLWQGTMKELKNRLGNIWIISDNAFILAAAKTMGILAGFSVKTARSLSDVR